MLMSNLDKQLNHMMVFRDNQLLTGYLQTKKLSSMSCKLPRLHCSCVHGCCSCRFSYAAISMTMPIPDVGLCHGSNGQYRQNKFSGLPKLYPTFNNNHKPACAPGDSKVGQHQRLMPSPLMRFASCMSLALHTKICPDINGSAEQVFDLRWLSSRSRSRRTHMMVTRLAWMQHKLLSSNSPTCVQQRRQGKLEHEGKRIYVDDTDVSKVSGTIMS